MNKILLGEKRMGRKLKNKTKESKEEKQNQMKILN